MPKPLIPDPITSRQAQNSVVSYFGYEFASVTQEVKEERKAENAVVLSFSDCAGVVIFKPQPMRSFIHDIQQGPPEARRAVENLFGKGAARSDYEL